MSLSSPLVLLVVLSVLACGAVVSGRSLNPLHEQVPLTPALEGEGTSCSFRGSAGTCTAMPCKNGYKVSGRCPGPKQVTCCIPDHPHDAQGSFKKVSLAGPFPYHFPYSQARHIVADIHKQRIRLYDGERKVREWKMSSGKNGVSFTPNSLGSPSGRFKVVAKYGAGAPIGMIFEARRAIGKIGYPTDQYAHMQTRILQLDGLDKENANTLARDIYIHGTNAEMQLGWQGSHGCFRMGNADVVELFDLVPTGVEFFAVPENAWPA